MSVKYERRGEIKIGSKRDENCFTEEVAFDKAAIDSEEYIEYKTLLQEKDEAVSRVSFEYTEAALNRLNEVIERLVDFRKKHAASI